MIFESQPTHPQPPPPAGTATARSLLNQFDRVWQVGPRPSIVEFLALIDTSDARERRAFLEELVMLDLEYRWQQRDPLDQWRLEDYARSVPELGVLSSASVELIGAEYRVRSRWGDQPGHDEYLARFPWHAAHILTVLAEIDTEMATETGQAPLEHSQNIDISEDQEAVPLATAVDAPLVPVATQPVGSVVVAPTGTLAPREIILGPYVILERIGEGGIGQVFKARHAHMDRIVAIKVLHPKLVTDPEVMRRFIREVQMAARLDHPHVVRAHDAGPAGSVYFLAMEYVPGTDLSRLVKQHGPLPVSLACNYIWQSALGLQYAHERGMVHRDIKPANLLLTKSSEADPIGLIKIADLGMARLTHLKTVEVVATQPDGEESSGGTTASGLVVMGTIDYMAPEQAIDFHNVDIRADIYSLGCTFYHLLTGHGPYSGTQAQKMLKHQQADIPDARLERPDVPAEVADILTRMMAKRSEDRFQTPAEVAVALAPLCGFVATSLAVEPVRDQTADAEGVSSNGRSGERGRSASGGWLGSVRGMVGVSVSLAILAVGVAWWLTRGPSPSTSDGTASGESTLDGSTPTAPLMTSLDELNLPADQRSPSVPKELVWIIQKPTGAAPGPMNVAFSGDGKWVACWRHDLIKLWDVRQAREWLLPLGDKSRVFGLAISPDGQTLVFAMEGQQPQLPQVWNLRKGEPKKANEIALLTGLGAQRSRLALLAFSADGKRLAGRTPSIGGAPGRVMLFQRDVNDVRGPIEKEITHVPVVQSGVASLVFAPDGKTLAVGLEIGDIFLWDPHWGDPNTSLAAVRGRVDVPKDAGAVTSLDFSPDGKYLLSTDNQGSLIWDLTSRTVRNPIKHETPAMSRFSQDGQQVFIWNKGSTALTAYDAQSSRKLSEWRSWPGRPAAWAADGRHVATSDDNGNVYIFRLPKY